MGLKIDGSYNGIEVKYSNAEASSILIKGDSIIEECFKGEKDLEEVTINDGVKIIGTCAFENCTSLATISLPSSLKRIERNSFVGCTTLKKIILPASLDEVDCRLDGGVAKLTLFHPSSDELIKELRKGYVMDFHYIGESPNNHWN